MHKRCITGILLAALLVSLCECTSVFDKEYLSVRPYEEPSNLLTDADTTQIRNYAGLMRALNTMAAQYERSFVLAFGDYDGIIADDLAAACEELRTGTAIGAYCIESVSYETEQVIAYCEASITITYNGRRTRCAPSTAPRRKRASSTAWSMRSTGSARSLPSRSAPVRWSRTT